MQHLGYTPLRCVSGLILPVYLKYISEVKIPAYAHRCHTPPAYYTPSEPPQNHTRQNCLYLPT